MTVSFAVLLLLVFFQYKEEDLEFLEKRKEPVQMENKVLQTGEFVGERIDRFLSCKLEEFSRSYIQRLMKEGHVSGRKVAKK